MNNKNWFGLNAFKRSQQVLGGSSFYLSCKVILFSCTWQFSRFFMQKGKVSKWQKISKQLTWPENVHMQIYERLKGPPCLKWFGLSTWEKLHPAFPNWIFLEKSKVSTWLMSWENLHFLIEFARQSKLNFSLWVRMWSLTVTRPCWGCNTRSSVSSTHSANFTISAFSDWFFVQNLKDSSRSSVFQMYVLKWIEMGRQGSSGYKMQR